MAITKVFPRLIDRGFGYIRGAIEPGKNLFNGADITAAEAARDAYFATADGLIDLAQMDSPTGSQILVVLTYGTPIEQTIVSRTSGAWVNSFNAATEGVDLSTHSVTDLNDVTSAGSGQIITAAERTKYDGYEATIADKADQSALDTTNSTVATKAAQSSLDTTNSTVSGLQTSKADQSSLDTTNQNVTTLSGQISDKAEQSALDTTNSNVSANATAIATKANQSALDTTNQNVTDLDSTKQATLVSGTNIKTVNNQSLLGSGNITIEGGGGADERVDWMLDTDVFEAPTIAYGSANVQVNSSGTIPLYVLGGTEPIVSFAVTTGSLPIEFTLDTETGELTYTTTATTKTGSFGITATNPAGDSSELTVNYDIREAQGRSEFTNSESIYSFMRITTSNSIATQILIKQDFYGRTTGTSSGTIIEDSAYPIYAASNGDGTWNYLIYPTGYSYWLLFKNSTTDPSTLANGLVSDIKITLTYDLVAPTSDQITVGGVNYPADQSDIHYGTGQNFFRIGQDSSLDGFMSDDNTWSGGMRLVDAMPRDALGRTLFAREGRNWHGFYVGHNDTYTAQLVGNGSSRTYDSEDASLPSGGFAAGSYVRITFASGSLKVYVNGTLYWNYTPSIYWDSATSVNSLDVLFGKGVESNSYQSNVSYYHGLWQGVIDRLWIANGVEISTDDDGTTYPAGTTHAWDMSETTGDTFAAAIGGISMSGEAT